MIAPLSWLKKYVDVGLAPEKLGEKLTEVGLGTEKIRKEKDDVIFELEITPNRPDWLSIIGVAREIAAVEGKKIKYPELKTDLKPSKKAKILPLTIQPDFTCSQRMTGIIINNVSVKESPQWLKDKLISIDQRPINNIVDITNFVMYELGNPIHAFDYDKISGHKMWVSKAKGGEEFESVDEIHYRLPKGAIIYKDQEKIFDLAGIKGGRNSGTYKETKTIFILVAVDDPILIRKASQSLSLRSDASAIFERAVNKGGTIDALRRVVDLVFETAGGEIASQLIDLKEKNFTPWRLSLSLSRLEFILGIKIPTKEVVAILDRLNLSPKMKGNLIECSIPTFRNDLQIEEDLIEEVARIYGYNNFPKTMIQGQIPTQAVPYAKDYGWDARVKQILIASEFSEVYTYSLTSENDLQSIGTNPENVLRVDNPVSRDFEYLRPSLKSNLLKALKENKAKFNAINLFELGKVYLGKSLDKAEEKYMLSGISNKKNYFEVKGILEFIFDSLGIKDNATEYIEVLDEGIFFEIDYSNLLQKPRQEKIFKPLPKFPPIIEDITMLIDSSFKTAEVIDTIKKQSQLVHDVSLLDSYRQSRTFHIIYQSLTKNLTNEEVEKLREKIIQTLSSKFSAVIK